jgi:hypothetical protein
MGKPPAFIFIVRYVISLLHPIATLANLAKSRH